MTTKKGREFDAFQSIPYGQPPVGPLRFKDPEKNSPWDGIRDAIAQSPVCTQMDLVLNMEVTGQEDCLYLNVYRPKSSQKPLPVMIWIHGGGFFFGAGSIYGPAYLLDKEVILVTVNYRLGPFGFFSTGDDASPGNQALKDQVLAMKWVQENIKAFGGDPNSVTLFGESSGAGLVHLHVVSPVSNGLFHRAIAQSGCALCYWSVMENMNKTVKQVGKLLNCSGDSHQMIDCLRNVDVKVLASIQLKMFEWSVFPIMFFGPSVEHKYPGAFLTETPEESYKNGNANKIPWISGFTQNEMTWTISSLIIQQVAVDEINNDWDRVGPVLLDLSEGPEEKIQKAREIRKFYMGDKKFNWETRMEFTELFSDRFVYECGLEAVRYHSKFTGAPTYSYIMSFPGKYSSVQMFQQDPQDWGVAHLDDLVYLLNNTAYYGELQPEDSEELKMSEMLTTVWTNFATYGKPYISINNELKDIWQPIKKAEDFFSPIQLLDLNLTPKMIDDPYKARYAFWRGLNLID